MTEKKDVPYKINIIGEDEKEALPENIGNFLRDLVFAYDRLVFNFTNKYRFTEEPENFFSRNRRKLDSNDRLKCYYLSKESPIEIGLILGVAVGIPWLANKYLDLLIKVEEWKKLRKENEKLDLELEKLRKERGLQNIPSGDQMKKTSRDFERLTENNINVEEVKIIEYVDKDED